MATKVRQRGKIGLALGGGAARGWSHIGVIRALSAQGIEPDIICGTSIGALVGAACASGELDRFERWVRKLTLVDIVSLMDVSFNGGLLKGDKLMRVFQKTFADRPVSDLKTPFATVATDLHSGAEVWLRDGSTAAAVRASIALPGLLTPVEYEGRTLVDGGLVNPVPVSLARAMGADVVIAVDLNADIVGRHLAGSVSQTRVASKEIDNDWMRRLQERLAVQWPGLLSKDKPVVPSLFDVVASSINIMQVRITRSRMAGEPADVVISPRVGHLGLMDFHRADQAIEEGSDAVARVLQALKDATGILSQMPSKAHQKH
jgi:NTE family protein